MSQPQSFPSHIRSTARKERINKGRHERFQLTVKFVSVGKTVEENMSCPHMLWT